MMAARIKAAHDRFKSSGEKPGNMYVTLHCLVHAADECVDLLLTVSGMSSLNVMLALL